MRFKIGYFTSECYKWEIFIGWGIQLDTNFNSNRAYGFGTRSFFMIQQMKRQTWLFFYRQFFTQFVNHFFSLFNIIFQFPE